MFELSTQPDQNLTQRKFGKAVKVGDLVYSTFNYYQKVTWYQGKFIEIEGDFYEIYFSDGEIRKFPTDTDLLEPTVPEGDLFYVGKRGGKKKVRIFNFLKVSDIIGEKHLLIIEKKKEKENKLKKNKKKIPPEIIIPNIFPVQPDLFPSFDDIATSNCPVILPPRQLNDLLATSLISLFSNCVNINDVVVGIFNSKLIHDP